MRLRLAIYLAVAVLVAAIVVPSFLRARVSPGETGVVGDARSVISAQQVYASSNCGYFDRLECLAAPTGCIPGYPKEAPVFLLDDIASLGTRSGYVRRFEPGPRARFGAGSADRCSPSSLQSYAYVAVPAPRRGWNLWEPARPAYCADSSGVVCVMRDGSAPPTREGRCLIGRCEVLR
jgi:hypothetical protein